MHARFIHAEAGRLRQAQVPSTVHSAACSCALWCLLLPAVSQPAREPAALHTHHNRAASGGAAHANSRQTHRFVRELLLARERPPVHHHIRVLHALHVLHLRTKG